MNYINKYKIIIFFTLLALNQFCIGQNIFTNNEASFEFAPSGANGNQCEPCLGTTGRWFASHGSPELDITPTPHHGSRALFLAGRRPDLDFYSEGVFFDHTFLKDHYYTLSFYIWQGSQVNFKLANGLVNNSQGDGTVDSSLNIWFANPTNTQDLLINYDVTGAGWQLVEIRNFKPLINFSQLWIYTGDSMNAEANLDAGMLIKSCCIPYKEYQDTTDPPTTYVGQYIIAGDSITSSRPVGPVNFSQPWETIWQAGEADSNNIARGRITLSDGFNSGQNFKARVRDCRTSPLDISLSYTVTNTQVNGNCIIKLNTIVCFGSGRYTITAWNVKTRQQITGAGPIPGGLAFNVAPTEETEYEIRVLDQSNGQQIVRRIKIDHCGCPKPKDVNGVNKINDICGVSTAPNCFTIGKDLPLNASFKWLVEPSNAGYLDFIEDTTKSPTTVCIPTYISGTGYIKYKLVYTRPGCPPDTSDFTIFYKRNPGPNCYFYNGYGSPHSNNTLNEFTLGFNLGIDVEAVYIDLYAVNNPTPLFTFDLIRGVDFPIEANYHYFHHVFGEAVEDGINYRFEMRYKCRCYDVLLGPIYEYLTFN